MDTPRAAKLVCLWFEIKKKKKRKDTSSRCQTYLCLSQQCSSLGQPASALNNIPTGSWKREGSSSLMGTDQTRRHISWALSNCYKWGLGCEVRTRHKPCSCQLSAKSNQPLAPAAKESMISSNQAVWKPNTVSVPHAICHLLTVLSAQIYLNSDKRSTGCLFWLLIWWCNQMRRHRPTAWSQTVGAVSFPQTFNLMFVLWWRGEVHSLVSLPPQLHISVHTSLSFYNGAPRSAQCRYQVHLINVHVLQR